MENQNPRIVRSRTRTRLSAAGMSISDLLRDASRSPIIDTISTAVSRRISMTTSSSVSTLMAAAVTRSPVTRSTATGTRRPATTVPATNRSSTNSSAQGTISTRNTRSSNSASAAAATASTARVTASTLGRNSSASGSRGHTVRRRAGVEVLPTLQERSSASTVRRQIGEAATGSRGRSARNVHVDKEVQTDNRSDNDGVSVSLNALKRRRQSLSPTNLPCAICFNEMHPKGGRTVISLKCGHVFCNDCIEKNYERSKFCPLCLEPIQKRHFRKIYL